MYMKYGGLPPVVLQPNDECRSNLLKSLLNETYIIDILERNRVKKCLEGKLALENIKKKLQNIGSKLTE